LAPPPSLGSHDDVQELQQLELACMSSLSLTCYMSHKAQGAELNSSHIITMLMQGAMSLLSALTSPSWNQ